MPVSQRIAATLPVPPGVEATIAHAVWAEERGFDDVWFADSGTGDPLTLAAGVGMATKRVRIGTAIIPVFTRTPAVFAATALALHNLCDGRFLLGLGASSQTMVEGWNGVTFEKPLTRVKETATLVRSMLAGEKSNFDGATLRSHGYRQEAVAEGSVPVYIAGLRGKMLELAGEIGDGAVINLFPQRALPAMLEHVSAGAQRAGKTLGDREIVCRHQVLVTDDVVAGRDAFRHGFVPYYATPVYNKFLSWCGFEAAAADIAAGWAARDRERTARAMPDALVDEIAIIGSADVCRERVRELAEGGVTTHIIACPSPDPAQAQRTFDAFTGDEFQF
ncbi:MAG: putative F420-dependent oxidoreductase [Gammaproteobacteria bacterium]|jgi:probable F420-dependent oxidoreductase